MNFNKASNAELKQYIADVIKTRRIQDNLSQEVLALRSGVSLSTIARLESGTANMTLDNLLSLLKALGIASEMLGIFNQGQSPLQQAGRIAAKPRERVRSSHKPAASDVEWIWGDQRK